MIELVLKNMTHTSRKNYKLHNYNYKHIVQLKYEVKTDFQTRKSKLMITLTKYDNRTKKLEKIFDQSKAYRNKAIDTLKEI